MHIGGDECAFPQWASDPGIGEWMRRRGVSRVEQLQSWFMDVAADVLRENGKRVAVWDEACEIWDDQDALVVAWDESRGMQRIAAAGQRFVFADARTLYLNRIDPDAESPQKGMVPGISVADILTAPWPETADPRCIGVQAGVWSEFVLDGDDLMSMLFPRLLAVAERLWNPDLDPADAAARIAQEHAALHAAGALQVLEKETHR
ncbi:beta-hexosaminidase [Microbacterium sp. AR7-10]|nr:beta-hexosaminidase [Microbacterium sp. AR7-10]